ncbi:A-kinase anchor protein 1, mitochondrial [Anoplophora glabripennis]|uniref:A-kinase anchor protein 1, mitochondrial n=1 Tax=Anoplophora glabripennis TaxID=217634 RepID=UPI000873AFA8|nr:A-kinase anchor protein 1, mitochondrial [Anoplophora glabripennis]XP_018561972.1 A-kinase anchor protein 1, mitochondrial [Anoplophora glabripennis]XP_018561973.1 A-kinase anchor protein 1, mitochondrial [Anoplophora glabripennis]XP_018561975.1 A-kinase anchor protein 1, mitochondrial [Anoplophora glabripennis]XP_018561976.1 A-kinase anchor protein 1, mitochondrial [Anoplophora glabripennis]
MAPSHSRQLLVWSLPTIAVLFSYLWYKKKRIGARSDTGDTENQQGIGNTRNSEEPSVKEEEKKKKKTETKPVSAPSSPNRSFSRSLSGVESAPIDIVIPPSLRSTRSNPVVISDEDLDLEIEKIKSMKNGALSRSKPDNSPTQQQQSKTPSPLKESASPRIRTPSPLRGNTTTVKSKKSTKAGSEQQPAEMAQKDIAVVEDKLTSLKINNNNKKTPKKREHRNSTGKKEHEELQRQSSERDSANHSPADVMLASPSLSSISDNHSEGSSDSGKGGSDVATPPPSRTPGIDVPAPCDVTLPTLYEFIIPQSLVGKLIGRHGSFVTQIKEKTNAHIVVKKHPTNNKLKVCSIEGTQDEIDKSLKMIRDKFPAKRYPEVTLEQVHFTPIVSTVPLIPDHLYLKLIEGINNDTILSCLVAPNHLFLQQPTHPSFPSLNLLSGCMNVCYTEANSPLLPNPIPENTVCAAYSVDAWYRAMVLSTDVETDTSYVKFLDYGGFAYVENSKLRQIRGDFMLLPFQAAECVLDNVKSLNEDGTWPEEAYSLVADITKGALIYTQVADYTDAGVPLVLCYVVVGPQSVVFLNQHLVDNGFAEWVPTDEASQQDSSEGAVGGVNA